MKVLIGLFFAFVLAAPVLAAKKYSTADEALAAEDYPAAVELLKKAARRNDLDASYQLGVMYRDGVGVKRDPARAVEWFEDAAETDWIRDRGKFGLPQAQYALAVMYRDGIGTERDIEAAADWFRRAAEQGHGPSQLVLAEMYLHGVGVEQDAQSAYVWSSLVAESLSDEAETATQIKNAAAKQLSATEIADAEATMEKYR